ncbi:hypothetical protein Q9G90_06350 [Corynebacterium stationis]|nr:hypothetical protein [Corynebacterium stationis]WLP85993.1 hypothetical protein Q9G90_06350 [Corynebacterium stationis]
MLGHQSCGELPVVFLCRMASGDHGYGAHTGGTKALQFTQHLVLVVGGTRTNFFDRDDAAVDPHETHDVPGNTPGQRGDEIIGPLFQGCTPGQCQQCRRVRRRGDAHGLFHGESLHLFC